MKIRGIADIKIAMDQIIDTGDNWHRESIPGPNAAVVRDSCRVFEQLWDDAHVLPQRIVQTIEEGIYAEFKTDDRMDLILELYNEGTGVVFLLEHGKTIECIDISNIDRVNTVCHAIQRILKQ